MIATLIETCKLNGVEPQAYLDDVITRIVQGHPQRRLDELLPWAYPSTPTLQGGRLRTSLTVLLLFGQLEPKSGLAALRPWTNPLSREGFLRGRAQLEI